MTTFARSAPGHAGPGANKPRVLLLLREYPQLSQTYIKAEIEALEADYEIAILARHPAAQPYAEHRPFTLVGGLEEAVAAVELYRPDVLHTHFLTELGFLSEVARRTGVPFTVRSHSADTLALRRKGIRGRIRQMLRGEVPLEREAWFIQGLKAAASELCLGVLAFPCARPWLIRAGIPAAKIIDCFPAVAFDRFHDRSPNGDAVMNTGTAREKKAMTEFLRLARKVPGRVFNLYAIGSGTTALRQHNAVMAAGVHFADPIEPAAMPAEYKKHRWLVCTGDFDVPAVGWPVAIAEAQASGVGVCVPMLRPDLAQYVGEGAGVLYETIDELPAIVSGPVPEEMRTRGFEQARKSDIERHKHLLTDLWEPALRTAVADHDPMPQTAPVITVPRVAAASIASPA
jgi:hypothetical protein